MAKENSLLHATVDDAARLKKIDSDWVKIKSKFLRDGINMRREKNPTIWLI